MIDSALPSNGTMKAEPWKSVSSYILKGGNKKSVAFSKEQLGRPCVLPVPTAVNLTVLPLKREYSVEK